jgi:uncharacterized repeat protein (TIGR04076 family)
MAVSKETWKMLKDHLHYNDEEMRIFQADPRNEDVLSKTDIMMNKTIVAEVVEANGCDSGHKVGDKFYIDGRGVSLLTKLGPSRVCIFALHSLGLAIPAVSELIYAGADPNKMRFNRFGCSDVGVRCGGWGHIVMEVKVKDRKR